MTYLSILENAERKTVPTDGVTFSDSCDVLVVGVGTAGAYAAHAASREGARVIAVEKDENIGGMPINGRVTTYYFGARGGTFEEVDREAQARSPLFKPGWHQEDNKQGILSDLLGGSGVELICAATVTGVYLEDDRAVGIRMWKSGEYKNIHSKILIDATSDGHIIKMCPIETELGRPTDGKTVPFTVRSESVCEDGKCRYDNGDSGHCDQYRAAAYSQKIMTAHASKVRDLREGRQFVEVAPVCGVREGIRFEGEERLCYSDIIMERKPEKILFYAFSDLDKHGHDLALDEELFQNWWCISNLATVTVSIPVPMGSVVPRGLRGIVTAGRCLSIDSYASSAVRMIRDMHRMGECVGIACAQAVAADCDFMNIDYARYRERVEHFDCYAGERDKTFGFYFPGGNKPYVPVDFRMSTDAILQKLSTDCPGPAIWSCFRYGDDATAARLIEALGDCESPFLAGNAALALGIMGRRECLPKLREMVGNRSCFYFKDCRRSNQFPSVIAICLLGRLGDAEDLALLREIVFDDGEFEKPLYHTLEPDYLYCSLKNCNFVLFQHFSHAAMAMIKIAEREGIDLSADFERRFTGESREGILAAMTSQLPTEAFFGEVSEFMEHVLSRVRKG